MGCTLLTMLIPKRQFTLIKVKLGWFGAVLECKCKVVVFQCSFNITLRIIHNYI